MNDIYFDNASTTMPSQSVLEAIKPYIEEYWYNPSSLYSGGVKVRNDIEAVREQIAKFIHAKPEEIYFTSGAAEANNWAIRGFDDKYGFEVSRIISTNMEHASTHMALKNKGLRSVVRYLDNDMFGNVDVNSIHEHIVNYVSLASVIAANNEIGTIQDIKQIADVVHTYDGVFHTDATQLLPCVPINVKKMGIDMMSASAQKLGGLKGTGFLYIKNSIKDRIDPLIYGEQERGMRGGTENVIGIIAMGEAIKNIDYKCFKKVENERDYLIFSLEGMGCKLVGSRDNRLPNHVSVMLPKDCGGEEMLYTLDTCGIKCSTGSACNSRSVEPSHVLNAIGLDKNESQRVVRFTLPNYVNRFCIDPVLDEVETAIKLLRINSRCL